MFLASACSYFNATGCGDNIWNYLYQFLIPTLFATGIGLGIVALLASSISMITSAGSESLTKEAWEKIKSNFIGIAVLLLAFALVTVIIRAVSGTSNPNTTPPISESL